METYVVKLDPLKLRFKQRATAVLLASSLYFTLFVCWTYFWPTPSDKRVGVGEMMVHAGVVAVLWGIGMVFVSPSYKRPDYTLLVDDEAISGVSGYPGFKWLATRKTVHKGKIRTISEFKGRFGMPAGILLSERTGLRMRVTGWVYVPSTVPDYEYLKRLAESWRTSEDASR